MTQAKRPALLVDLINRFDFPGGEALARATRSIGPAVLRLRQHFDSAGHR